MFIEWRERERIIPHSVSTSLHYKGDRFNHKILATNITCIKYVNGCENVSFQFYESLHNGRTGTSRTHDDDDDDDDDIFCKLLKLPCVSWFLSLIHI